MTTLAEGAAAIAFDWKKLRDTGEDVLLIRDERIRDDISIRTQKNDAVRIVLEQNFRGVVDVNIIEIVAEQSIHGTFFAEEPTGDLFVEGMVNIPVISLFCDHRLDDLALKYGVVSSLRSQLTAAADEAGMSPSDLIIITD